MKIGGGASILIQFSNFKQDFVDSADFYKYLTNSGGKLKKKFLCQKCLKMDSRKGIFGSRKKFFLFVTGVGGWGQRQV